MNPSGFQPNRPITADENRMDHFIVYTFKLSGGTFPKPENPAKFNLVWAHVACGVANHGVSKNNPPENYTGRRFPESVNISCVHKDLPAVANRAAEASQVFGMVALLQCHCSLRAVPGQTTGPICQEQGLEATVQPCLDLQKLRFVLRSPAGDCARTSSNSMRL